MQNEVIEYLKKHREKHLSELKEFLSIQSISALSSHNEDVKKAAEWVKNE